jgi:hypothetical protein
LLGYAARLDEYDDNDPYPIVLPDKTISSAEAKKCFTPEYFHYIRVYARIKHVGNPFNSGWLDWPRWVVQLQMALDAARSDTESYIAARNNKRR